MKKNMTHTMPQLIISCQTKNYITHKLNMPKNKIKKKKPIELFNT